MLMKISQFRRNLLCGDIHHYKKALTAHEGNEDTAQ